MKDSRLMQLIQLIQPDRPEQIAALAPLAVTAVLLVILMVTRCAPALRRRDGAACSMCLALSLLPLFFVSLACGMTPRVALLNAATSTLMLALGTLVLAARPRPSAEVGAGPHEGRRRTDSSIRVSASRETDTPVRRG